MNNIPPAPSENARDKQATRRQLLRNTALGVPVVMTLASRPVLAGTCISPSRTLSGNLSRMGDDLGTCNGMGVAQWKAANAWPLGKGLKFNDQFPDGPTAGTRFVAADGVSRLSLKEVMELDGTLQSHKLAQHFLAALFNIRKGFVHAGALTEITLKNMWNEYAASGKYQPFAGGKAWFATDIINYFVNNSIAPD